MRPFPLPTLEGLLPDLILGEIETALHKGRLLLLRQAVDEAIIRGGELADLQGGGQGGIAHLHHDILPLLLAVDRAEDGHVGHDGFIPEEGFEQGKEPRVGL